MITTRFFDNNHFILHGVTGKFKGKCTAWYNDNGELLDCEQYPSPGTCKHIKTAGPMWNELNKIGKLYKKSLTFPNTRCKLIPVK